MTGNELKRKEGRKNSREGNEKRIQTKKQEEERERTSALIHSCMDVPRRDARVVVDKERKFTRHRGKTGEGSRIPNSQLGIPIVPITPKCDRVMQRRES